MSEDNQFRFDIRGYLEEGGSDKALTQAIQQRYEEITQTPYLPNWKYVVETRYDDYLALIPPSIWYYASDHIPSLVILLDILRQIGGIEPMVKYTQITFKEVKWRSVGVMSLIWWETEEWTLIIDAIGDDGAGERAVIKPTILKNIEFLEDPDRHALNWRPTVPPINE